MVSRLRGRTQSRVRYRRPHSPRHCCCYRGTIVKVQRLFLPLWRRYVDEVYIPQSKELNQLYKPDLIWSDGDWEANSSCALFASAALPSSVPFAEKRELMQVLTRAVCTQTGNQQSSSHGCTTTPQTVTRWWSTIDGALSAL